MLNWRHERYCWVPYECPSLAGISFDARALVTYLAKHADRVGAVRIAGGQTSLALARLVAVDPAERREFSSVVTEALDAAALVAAEGTVTLPRFAEWQRTRSPRARLFTRETPAFAKLGAFARMYAAEFVRRAERDGVIAEGSTATVAAALAVAKGERLSSAAHAVYRNRLHTRILELVAEGFLTVDHTLRIRNYGAAQEGRAAQEERRSAGGGATLPPRNPSKSLDSPRPNTAKTRRDLAAAQPVEITGFASAEHGEPVEGCAGRCRDVAGTLPGRCRDVLEAQPMETIALVSCFSSRIVSRDASHPLVRVDSDGGPTQHAAISEVEETKTPEAPKVRAESVTPSPLKAPAAEPVQPTLFDLGPAVAAPPRRAGGAVGRADGSGRGVDPADPSEAPADPSKGRREAPLPFTVEQALQALAEASQGRFVIGHPSDWRPRTRENLALRIRRFSDLSRWTLVGEWLAATRGAYQPVLTPNWAATNAMADAMVTSRAWRENTALPAAASAGAAAAARPVAPPAERTRPPESAAPAALPTLVETFVVASAGSIVRPDPLTAAELEAVLAECNFSLDEARAWGADLGTSHGRKLTWPWLRNCDGALHGSWLRSHDPSREEKPWRRVREGLATWRHYHEKKVKAHARNAASARPPASPTLRLATPADTRLAHPTRRME